MKFPRVSILAAILIAAAAFTFAAERNLYPDPSLAKAQIAAALKTASRTHKRVLLDFGGNWCGDCIVLNMYFHSAQNRLLLEKNFVLVDVNVGEYDANLDLAKEYEIPLQKGVPALAVLSDAGKLLYSQRAGEFEAMRRMSPDAVTHFLVQWKPGKKGCSVVAVNC